MAYKGSMEQFGRNLKRNRLNVIFITIWFIVGLIGTNGSTCSNGPYLYDESCNRVSQGIGSSMNRMKPSLLFASLMNATLIPNHGCFQSSEHDTDLLEYFGWEDGLDCTMEDVLTSKNNSAKGNLIHIDIEHRLKNSLEEWRKHNNALNHVCKMYKHGRVSKQDPATFWSHHSRNPDSMFHAAYQAMESAKQTTNTNIVYVLKQTFLFEGYECFRDWIYHRWRFHGRGQHLDNKDLSDANEGEIYVAFHFRHGDVATKDVNYIDPWQEVRTIPLTNGIQVLQKLQKESILRGPWARGQISLHFFSEGAKEEFKSLVDAFPEVNLHLGTNETLEEDLSALASADILVASPSSFTTLAIALNHDGVALIPRDNPEKFAGLRHLVSQEEVSTGHVSSFNKAFCRAKLHLRSGPQVRNSLCADSPAFPVSDTRREKTQRGHDTPSSRPKVNIGVADYETVYHELLNVRGRVLPSMNVHDILKLLEENSKIRMLLGSLISSDHNNDSLKDGVEIGSCRRNPDRQAFSMPEYQPTVCSRKARASALSVPFAFIVRSIAQAIVDEGFQPSVYIVHGGDTTRRERISRHLEQAGFDLRSVHWETGFIAGNLTDEEKAVFVTSRVGSSRCTEMMNGMDRACKYGYQFSASERSVALKHISIFQQVANSFVRQVKISEESVDIKSYNKTKNMFEQFALVLEDDQFIPRDARRQIVEIILQAPRALGFVMLDDSFFFMPAYNPPSERANFVFAGSYARPEGRTMGAYLMSQEAASVVMNGKYLTPMYAPCDHQLGYAIKKASIITHWAWPPVTCAGSQGLETYYTKSTTGGINMDSGDRLNCLTCCDRFVNTSTMRQIYDFV